MSPHTKPIKQQSQPTIKQSNLSAMLKTNFLLRRHEYSKKIAKLMNSYRMSERGMTLTELLVVIAIIGILAALAAPSFQDQMQQQKVEGAAESFVAALQNAKAEAIKTNASNGMTIVFTSTGAVCTGSACAVATNAISDWCYGMTKAGDTTCDCTAANSCATGSVVQNTDYSGVGVTFNASKSRKFDALQGTATQQATVRFFAGNKSLGVTTSQIGRIRICKDAASTVTSYTDSGACP